MRKGLLALYALFLSSQCALADEELRDLNDAIALHAQGAYEQSVVKLVPLAERGIPVAQLLLGKDLLLKFIPSHNCDKAKYWLTRSAEAGDAEAALVLGDVLISSECGSPNKWLATNWYLKADSLGHADAANLIGEIYLTEVSHPAEAFESKIWFIRGVRHYDWRAARNLGRMYSNGIGVARNMFEAYKWYQVAYLQVPYYSTERIECLEARDSVREGLTPNQVREASKSADRILDSIVAGLTESGPVSDELSSLGALLQ